MRRRVAIVDQRLDLLEFLKEKIEARGYEVIPVFTEAEADALDPAADVTVLDFEEFGVDVEDVLKMIQESLAGA